MFDLTVIVTAYGERPYLRFALESVVRQSIDPSRVQVIILHSNLQEEGQMQESLASIKRAFDTRVVARSESSFGGFRSKGIEMAEGDAICFLDDDDIWSPNRLDVVNQCFKSTPNLCYYHNRQFFVDEFGQVLGSSAALRRIRHYSVGPQSHSTVLRGPLSRSDVRLLCKTDAGFNSSSVALSREFAKSQLDLFSRIPSHDDFFHLVTAIASRRPLYLDNRQLTGYRVHGRNQSMRRVVGPPSINDLGPESMAETTVSILRDAGLGTNDLIITDLLEREYAYLTILRILRSGSPHRKQMLAALLDLATQITTFNPVANLVAIFSGLSSLFAPGLTGAIYGQT